MLSTTPRNFIPKCIVLAGPTAVGKSAVAIELARRCNGEIVSADAMQLYRDIRIATARPATLDGGIAHHVIDCIDPEEDCDVAVYRRLARAAVDDIAARGKTPVIVGGSGMYLEVLIDGIFQESAADPDLRLSLEEEARLKGAAGLHDRLKAVDPEAAQNIAPTDTRRLIRALEVHHTTGQPISKMQKQRTGGLTQDYTLVMFVLNRDRAGLYARINRRVDRMMVAGLEQEIRALSGRQLSRTAAAIIGLPEINAYLRGEADLAAAVAQVKQNTRRLAKRQLTWFRKDPRWQWIEIPDDEPPAATAARVGERIAAGPKITRSA